MGGVDVGGGGKGKRKTLDSEINMIPMIDLLMVTISFLLITAVWTHMARINADAQTPGKPREDQNPEDIPNEKQLHVEVKSDSFKLIWKTGATVSGEGAIDVARTEEVRNNQVTFPKLKEELLKQWDINKQHSAANDLKKDQAILHTEDKLEYRYIIGVIDAIYATRRDLSIGGKTTKVPVFNVTFSPSAVSN